MVAMETKLMAALATIAALSLHHLSLAIADHTRVLSNSSAGFSLPLFTKPSPNRAIRRGTDGFLYLQHNLTAASVTANFTPIDQEDNRHHTGPMFDGEASPTFRHVDSRVCRPPRCLFTIKGAGGLMVKGLVSAVCDAGGWTGVDTLHPEMFTWHKDGQGGSIIDVGTPMTIMAQEAYRVVEEAMWTNLERHGAERVEQAGYGLCVRATEAIKEHLQPMSLHFAEEEAMLVISPKQLFLMMDDKRAGQIACLAMKPAGGYEVCV
ncbi:hypothetical protein HU200_063756 [Digitaria exilis]|uniref:Xylanase inhibitor C-terminal domain-containing protein n=1 Tax=Digitaria exilis TaxID=1010633 RepID=A0A835A161_9POAL|nr:hypothetical protein HU200_063756 [Digitaria exilis]